MMSDTDKRKPCSQKPCKSKPEVRDDSHTDDVNQELRGRPVLYTGVIWIGILRRFLIPRTCGSSLPPAKPPGPKSVSHFPPSNDRPADHSMLQPAASLLNNKQPDDSEELLRKKKEGKNSHSPLAALVSQIQDQARRLSNDINVLMQDGRETTTETLTSLRREDTPVYRCGVVTVSGLVGYLAGLSRGPATRLVYSVTGVTAMAAVCYPQEAKHYNSQGLALLRRCIVFSLALVRDGPQKALGKGDSKLSKWSESDASEEGKEMSNHNPQTQPKPKTPQSTVTLLGKNFGTLGHGHDPSRNIPNRPFPADSAQREKKPPPHQTAVPHTEEHKTAAHSSPVGKLSMQCQRDVTRSLPPGTIPVSPALPAPPKETSDLHQYPQNKSHNQHPSDETSDTKQKAMSSLHSYSLHDSLRESDIFSTDQKTSQPIDEMFLDNRRNVGFGMVPPPEPTVVMEDEQKCSSSEDFGDSQHHPLNKKLSRYYMKKPEETLASLDKGYDDLYSKRE